MAASDVPGKEVDPATGPAGFRLKVPPEWRDFSVADDAAENRLAADIWTRAVGAGLSEQVAGEFTDSVRRSVRLARRAGTIHATGVFEMYEDGPLMATVTVSVVLPPSGGDVLGALTAVQRAELPDGTWRRTGTAEIPGIGTVGRVHGIQKVGEDEEQVPCAVMHTVVPLPGSSSLMVVTGCSPNVAEADAMFHLFDRITETLELPTAA